MDSVNTYICVCGILLQKCVVMGKVLISFLGTGPRSNFGKSQREYNKTIYSFEGVESEPTALIADAIMKHHNIDKAIIVGTPHSMWEGLYYNMCESNGISIDENVFIELGTYSDSADSQSPLQIPHKDALESTIGKDIHIELIRYGLNQNEIMENESIILGLEKYLRKGDDLYLDITHSFRSLPLFAMNLIIYLQNVSSKAVNIRSVAYGMFEASSERIVNGVKMSVTPVVELNSVVKLSEWITGAYSFSQFGNGYEIARLLKKENSSASEILRNFSDVMNLNHLDGVRVQSKRLASIKNILYSPIPACIIPSTVNGFIDEFPTDVKKSVFLLKTASWHYEHKNFSSSFISLLESILTHICETLDLPSETAKDMEVAKGVLGKKVKIEGLSEMDFKRLGEQVPKINILSKSYHRINNIRNGLAHQSTIEIYDQKTRKDKAINSEGMIEVLKEEMKNVSVIIR